MVEAAKRVAREQTGVRKNGKIFLFGVQRIWRVKMSWTWGCGMRGWNVGGFGLRRARMDVLAVLINGYGIVKDAEVFGSL